MESLVLFLPFLLIMGGFMFFASRRQRRAMQATIDLHDSLQPGDRVHTTSGLEATIAGIGDDTVDLEIAPGVVTTWMKLAIRDKILPDADEDILEDEYTEDDELDDSDLGDAEHETRATKEL
jgi:preprotein translocase subunit YajC